MTTKATIEAIGVVGNGDTKLIIRSDDKHQPVFYQTMRMSLEEVVNFINSLIKDETKTL